MMERATTNKRNRTNSNKLKKWQTIGVLGCLLALWAIAPDREVLADTYYVSSSSGSDANTGLSEASPFQSIGKVNSLSLRPGDNVRFKCGDTWRAQMLTIKQSGTAGNPITYGCYPQGCTNSPVLSGAHPISGWTTYTTNIYVANLNAGDNMDRFAFGINQLFRSEQRLPMGRWPNLDAGDNGYSSIDQQSGTQITDHELPNRDWTGAVAHIKGMRWYILNREITGNAGQTLTLGAATECWNGCSGWGYFVNRHLATLDQEGEWYYDTATQRIYLYTAKGRPADGEVEGSVILKNDDRSWGGITLGEDLNAPGISYCTVENLDIRRWFRHGIATPTNHAHYENHHIILRKNSIRDVDGIGINLASWVWDAQDGRPSGWRGGYNMTIQENSIDTANSMGMDLYSRNSLISYNTIRNIGMIRNLGSAGLGCDLDASGGRCTEDGDGIRIKIDKAEDTGNGNTLTGNTLEHIAYNGFDVFGSNNTIERNLIRQACQAKGDCGGVRTFGRDNLDSSAVHDLVFRQNIIDDTIGNTDGCAINYKSLFGFGFYIDNYSRNITLSDNTVMNSTVHGILYQNSTGTVTGNTLYNNGYAADWSAQVWLTASPTYVSNFTDNVLYSLNSGNWTLSVADVNRLGVADNNYYFNPYRNDHIRSNGNQSLSSWQSASGKDTHSKESWFTLGAEDSPNSSLFYNDTAQTLNVDLSNSTYLNLDQDLMADSMALEPFSSQVLVNTSSGSQETADKAAYLYLTDPGQQWHIPVNTNAIVTGSAGVDIVTISQGAAASLKLAGGNDLIYLEAPLSDYEISARQGQLSLTDPNGNKITILADSSTKTVAFSDGAAQLRLDSATGNVTLAGKHIDAGGTITEEDLNPAPAIPPTSNVANKKACLILVDPKQDWEVPRESNTMIYGNNGIDTVTLPLGVAVSLYFGTGEDIVNFKGNLSDYTIGATGATLKLQDEWNNTISISASTAPKALVFNNGTAQLRIDPLIPAVVLAGKNISAGEMVTDTDL